MSTELKEFGGVLTSNPDTCKDTIGMTQYWGGETHKMCIQLTQYRGVGKGTGYIQLTAQEAESAIEALQEWLDGKRPLA